MNGAEYTNIILLQERAKRIGTPFTVTAVGILINLNRFQSAFSKFKTAKSHLRLQKLFEKYCQSVNFPISTRAKIPDLINQTIEQLALQNKHLNIGD